MKNNNTPKITIEKLAQSSQKKFTAVHGRIDKLETNINGHFELVMEELRELKQSNHDILNAVRFIMEHATGKFETRLEMLEKRLTSLERSRK